MGSGDVEGAAARADDDDEQRRAVIAESWQRCRAIGLDRGANPRSSPIGPAFFDYRRSHAMHAVQALLEETIGDESVGTDSFVFITDERAGGLWTSDREGPRAQLHSRSLAVLLSEESAGTTAPALALLYGSEMQVDGPEHYLHALANLWAAAAPIRDEATGRVIGTVCVATVGDQPTAQKVSLIALRSIVRLITDGQALDVVAPVLAAGTAADGARVVTCGPDAPRVVLSDGTDRPLTRRQCEILVLLVWQSSGLSAERLAVALSETSLDPVTVRAEVSRLRATVGGELLRSRPYRLDPTVTCDLVDVATDATAGRLERAVSVLSSGCVLAHSTAPGVIEIVDEVVSDVGSAALASPDVAALEMWTSTVWGRRDEGAWRRLAELSDDPRTATRAEGRASLIDRRDQPL